MEVRKDYPEIADEMLTGMRTTIVMPTLPRKPRKQKKRKKVRGIKSEGAEVKVEDIAAKGSPPSFRKGTLPPPPTSATKVYEVESDSSVSSFDTDYEEEMSVFNTCNHNIYVYNNHNCM